jgi:hypothetical protein
MTIKKNSEKDYMEEKGWSDLLVEIVEWRIKEDFGDCMHLDNALDDECYSLK